MTDKVTVAEIVKALRNKRMGNFDCHSLAKRIEQHGIAPEPTGEEAIAPPDRWVLVPSELLDLTRFMCQTWKDKP